YFSALKHKTPLFTILPGPRPSLVRLHQVYLSRNRIGSSSQSPTEIILVAFKPTDSNTNYFDNRGSTASKGMNGIVAVDNQRFKGYINGCGMCGSVGHPPNDCPILREPPPPFRPQPVQESSLEDLIKQLSMNNIQFQKNVSVTQQPVHFNKNKCHNARVESTNWSTGHHDKSAAVRRFWIGSFPSHSQSTREYE
ncbi:hypothetical protein CR513_33501, partial [Mucuna pruriens]